MTDSRDPSNGEWDDARLDAAFKARFDRPAPTGLADRVAADLGRTTTFPGWRAMLPPIGWAFVVTAAAVAILVAGARLLPAGPGARSSPPAGTSGTPRPAATPISGGIDFPSNVVMPATGEVLPVLAIPNALIVRDRGADASVIAVKGWFVRNEVPCPMPLTSGGPLARCDANYTWLMEDPEQLSVTDSTGAGTIHAPVGPAFNVVVDWNRPLSDKPEAVVLIGHFDDPLAAQCPDRERCADKLVVDQVAWTAAEGAVAFPETLGGIHVSTMSEAIEVRTAESGLELAVRGWYQQPPVIFCAFISEPPAGPLSRDCSTDHQWLTAEREDLFGTDALKTPTGPAIGLAVPIRLMSQLGAASSKPADVVLIGHFNDRRAALCEPDRAAACSNLFVVDAVGWVDGDVRPLPGFIDLNDPATPLIPAQQAAISAFVADHAPLLQIFVGDAHQVAAIEPGLLTSEQPGAAILSDERSVWLANTWELPPGASAPFPRTYVIDADGRLYIARGPDFFALGPEPSPSP